MSTRPYAGVPASQRQAQRRAALLAAALEIVDAQGMNALTVTGLCRAAQVKDRYFYESFASTDEVLVAMVDQIATELAAAMLEASEMAGQLDLEESVRVVIAAMVDFWLADPRRARVGFLESAGVPAVIARRQQIVGRFVGLTRALSRARFDMPETEQRVQATHFAGVQVFGGLLETTRAWLRGDLELSREDFISHAQTAFCATLQALIVS